MPFCIILWYTISQIGDLTPNRQKIDRTRSVKACRGSRAHNVMKEWILKPVLVNIVLKIFIFDYLLLLCLCKNNCLCACIILLHFSLQKNLQLHTRCSNRLRQSKALMPRVMARGSSPSRGGSWPSRERCMLSLRRIGILVLSQCDKTPLIVMYAILFDKPKNVQ